MGRLSQYPGLTFGFELLRLDPDRWNLSLICGLNLVNVLPSIERPVGHAVED